MGTRRQPGLVRRAITAVIAGYALLLQSFLVAAAPSAEVGLPGQAICAPGHEAGPASGKVPPAHDHRCCTAAGAAASALPPPLAFVTMGWPGRDARPVTWRSADSIEPRAPPRPATSARGPPAP